MIRPGCHTDRARKPQTERIPEVVVIIRRLPVLFFVVASLLAALAVPAAARAPIALGITRDHSNNGRDLSTLTSFTDDVDGNQPALWSIWSQWGSRGGVWECYTDGPSLGTCRFPSSTVEALPAAVIPVVWWEPTDPDHWEKGRFERYRNIIKGKHDAYIRQWARDARDTGRRVLLRFAHEANGDYFPWGVRSFDNNKKTFKKAWRKVWRLFQQEGATNVEFLWSVSRHKCKGGCNPFKGVYPGNQYVDWAGITAFNWGKKRKWVSMKKALALSVRQLQQASSRRIIVCELGSHFKGGNKANWIKFGYRQTYATWPRIRAIIYLDSDQRYAGHVDWRLSKPNDGSALASYRDNVASDPRFQGTLPPAPA